MQYERPALDLSFSQPASVRAGREKNFQQRVRASRVMRAAERVLGDELVIFTAARESEREKLVCNIFTQRVRGFWRCAVCARAAGWR